MDFDDLAAAWRANCAANRGFIDLCADEDLELKPGKGKTIRSNFVHILGFRRSHLEDRLKARAIEVPKLDWQTATRPEIESGLEVSDALMVEAFRRQEETGKPGRWTSTLLFFAYCIAHEAHHRSQIEIALRINGREPSDAALYALWNWPGMSKS
ncbi:MAG TPA: DinB family protein [Fimbriimonadaceae bacterium]|nr:DinB family protein [Fimbriimonadaceae bacterium]